MTWRAIPNRHWAKVFRIFKLNAWDFKEGGALFKLGSKFPHQCVSNNTFYHANDDNGRAVQVDPSLTPG